MQPNGLVLGVDLGTTFSTIAAGRLDTAVEDVMVTAVSFGEEGSAIPSVLSDEEQGGWLVGLAAIRNGIAQPERVVREFKRRFGDETPFVTPSNTITADRATATLYTHLVNLAVEQIGLSPAAICVAHPANWGEYKVSLLKSVLATEPIPPTSLISEPEAAAWAYAREADAVPESLAVFDLGGGTFDVAVASLRGGAVEKIMASGGIERLGGVDFDAVLWAWCLELLELNDLGVATEIPADLVLPLTKLREDIQTVKHLLSVERTATVAVHMPEGTRRLVLQRDEFESRSEPLVRRAVEHLESVLQKNPVDGAAIGQVLAVGGTSNVPLIANTIAARPELSVHHCREPQTAVARGAAWSLVDQRQTTLPTDPKTERTLIGRRGAIGVGLAAATGLALSVNRLGVFQDPPGSNTWIPGLSGIATNEPLDSVSSGSVGRTNVFHGAGPTQPPSLVWESTGVYGAVLGAGQSLYAVGAPLISRAEPLKSIDLTSGRSNHDFVDNNDPSQVVAPIEFDPIVATRDSVAVNSIEAVRIFPRMGTGASWNIPHTTETTDLVENGFHHGTFAISDQQVCVVSRYQDDAFAGKPLTLRMAAYDENTHNEMWERNFGTTGTSLSHEIVLTDALMLVQVNDTLFALDRVTGDDVWQRALSNAAQVSAVNGSVIVPQSSEESTGGRFTTRLYVLDEMTGVERYAVDIDSNSKVLYDNTLAYLALDADTNVAKFIVGLDLQTGNELGRIPIPSSTSSAIGFVGSPEALYVLSKDGLLSAFAASSGELLFSNTLVGSVESLWGLQLVDGYIIQNDEIAQTIMVYR